MHIRSRLKGLMLATPALAAVGSFLAFLLARAGTGPGPWPA